MLFGVPADPVWRLSGDVSLDRDGVVLDETIVWVHQVFPEYEVRVAPVVFFAGIKIT